ncbi:MAG: peptidyl-prolyl cis-trans isomerase [Lysobacteraceae bacterium]|nr:MAG: peptidyl-prolyl cis-trans isomerase [Xanthomonadaceae bacterium]
MQAEKDRVVRFHYWLRPLPEPDALLESSAGGEPVTVLLGHGALLPALEQALLGRSAGERFSVDVEAGRAYGPHRPELVQRVSRKHFKDPGRLRAGQQALVATRDGPRPVTVLKVGMSVVDVDLNHPLAGRDLRFEIELIEVRAATPEELEHGHAHGPGGHRHD